MSSTMMLYRGRFPAGAASVANPASRLPDDEVQRTLEEVLRLVELERDARRNVAAAGEALKLAQDQDAQAHAAAIRAGKSEPKSEKEPKAIEALRTAEKRLAALEVAAATAHSELLAMLGARRGKLERAIDEKAEELASDAHRLADEAVVKLMERDAVMRTRGWLADPHAPGGIAKSRSVMALSEARKLLEEDARPVEVDRGAEAATMERRFHARVREIEVELIADGREHQEAHEMAHAAALREAGVEPGQGPQQLPKDYVYAAQAVSTGQAA